MFVLVKHYLKQHHVRLLNENEKPENVSIQFLIIKKG